jgi:hypothetical protein
MVRRVRDLVTLIVFLGMVAVSLAASIEAARQGLPEPEVTDPVERLQWLADHDIRQQPKEVKLRLAHRLEEDFARNLDWQAEIDQFDDAEWARFEANFEDLMRLWFLQKVNTWSNLPADQQNYYIDEQFNYLMSWQPLARNASMRSGRGGRRAQFNSFPVVAKRIERTIAAESPAQRARIEEFVQAVFDRAMLQFTFPGPFGRNLD